MGFVCSDVARADTYSYPGDAWDRGIVHERFLHFVLPLHRSLLSLSGKVLSLLLGTCLYSCRISLVMALTTAMCVCVLSVCTCARMYVHRPTNRS